MPPFDSNKVSVPFGSTTKSDIEQSQGGQMEVNFVVAQKFHPTKLEVTYDIGNILDTIDYSDITQRSENVKNLVPTKINIPHIDSTTLMIFNATVNVDSKVLVIGTNMDTKDATLVQLETIAKLVNTLLNTSTALENINIGVEVVD
jgi:hypothetical protein